MNADEPIVRLHGVMKEYDSGAARLRVLHDIDFELRRGECAAVIGPSGCGKSTLLNIMGTLDTPTSGEVRIKGRDTASMKQTDIARLRNDDIGFVFQLHHLLPQCTVLENVLVPTLVGKHDPDVHERARKLLFRAGLGERLHHRPGQLSGGERQRVAVVRALINRPALLLADEPTGSLNEEGAASLVELLLDLNREEDMAMAIVTHSTAVADRVGCVFELHNGRLKPKA